MAYDRQKVIDRAISYLGYIEKETNSNLDSKTANAGDENYTKFARELDKLGWFYNGPKQGYAWCDVFVDDCFVEAYGVEAALELLCQPKKSTGAGCTFSAQFYRNKGQFHKSDPQPGDQIFFGKTGDEYHTGIVEKIAGGYVYTIEGNTSSGNGVDAEGGGVFRKKYRLGSSAISGYGRPNYGGAAAAQPESKNESASENNEEVCKVELRQLYKGHKGQDVKALQLLLLGNGISCGNWGADGDFGSDTDAAVRAYQRKKGLDVDGIVGPATWGKLLGVS